MDFKVLYPTLTDLDIRDSPQRPGMTGGDFAILVGVASVVSRDEGRVLENDRELIFEKPRTALEYV